MHRSSTLAFGIAVAASLSAFRSTASAQAGAGGVIHRDSVPAPALRNNMVRDPHWDRVSIYLPPSYSRAPSRRYPVIYVDRKYRTLRTRRARGIAGHSMGGYGALRIAMRHPETFSAVYALSAYGLAFADSVEGAYEKNWRAALALSSWQDYPKAGFITDLLMAFGAANAPDLHNPPFYVSLPYIASGDSLVLDRRIARRWSMRPLEMAPDHVANLRRLSIAFDAGTTDGFKDIPIRANELDELLSSLKVPHSFELYEGGHGDHIRARIETKMLPFFSRVLEARR